MPKSKGAIMNRFDCAIPQANCQYINELTGEPEFIEAIQLAVIKYLELKNANSRIQQTI